MCILKKMHFFIFDLVFRYVSFDVYVITYLLFTKFHYYLGGKHTYSSIAVTL